MANELYEHDGKILPVPDSFDQPMPEFLESAVMRAIDDAGGLILPERY